MLLLPTSEAVFFSTLAQDSGSSDGSIDLHLATLSSGRASGSGGSRFGVDRANTGSKDAEKKSSAGSAEVEA